MPDKARIARLRATIQEERPWIFKLAQLMTELKDTINTVVAESGTTLNTLCIKQGNTATGHVYKFLKGKLLIRSGTALSSACKISGKENLESQIVECNEHISHKRAFLALYPEHIIELVLALQEIYFEHGSATCSLAEFALLFRGYEDEMKAVLSISRTGVDALHSDEQFLSYITKKLGTGTFRQEAQKFIKAIKAGRQKAINAYLTVTQQLLSEHYADIVAMCAELGYASTTHNGIMRGDRTEEAIQRYTVIAAQHLDELTEDTQDPETTATRRQITKNAVQQAQPNTPPAAPRDTPAPDQITQDSASTKGPTLRKIGGVRSILNVELTITAETFKKHDILPNKSLIEFAIEHLEITRALLNMLCQIRDDRTRAKIRERLGPEVFELTQSINTFTDEHPSATLLQIRDAQRAIAAEDYDFHTTQER